jgi:hypothetical protein
LRTRHGFQENASARVAGSLLFNNQGTPCGTNFVKKTSSSRKKRLNNLLN